MSKKKAELSLNDTHKTELKKLVEELKKIGVESVSWDFQGSGDSGYIESGIVEPGIHQKSADGWLDSVDSVIHEILNDAGYDWWNNEGGFGKLTINVLTGVIDLDMNLNVEASEAYLMKTKL